jgi:hypothetical protein
LDRYPEGVSMNIEDSICISGEKDYEYYKYLQVRGYGVYQIVYQAVSLFSGKECIDANDFKGLMRYDKRLRDNLYIYLATAEEYLKSEIWNRLKYMGDKIITKLDNYAIARLETSTEFDYNFFKHSSFDFITICEINDKFQLGFNNDDLYNIRKLRNKVMHHNFLLIDAHDEVTIDRINNNLEQINSYLNSLYRILPPKWNESFKIKINQSNIDNQNSQLLSKYIKIEVI